VNPLYARMQDCFPLEALVLEMERLPVFGSGASVRSSQIDLAAAPTTGAHKFTRDYLI
jgi:hypothetical protein